MSGGANYEQLVEKALRAVVHDVLEIAGREGLCGDQHFYLTFRTTDPRNRLPPWLLVNHPEEMSVILQHQFWDLSVDAEAFEVTLSFGGKPERLRVAFDAISAFSDPAAKFDLQFRTYFPEEEAVPHQEPETETAKPATSSDSDNVVTLDAFRKK